MERRCATDTSPADALHLPGGCYPADVRYMVWSTDGFRALANGCSGFDPSAYAALRADVAGFPDERSWRALRRYGVRSVVVHGGRGRTLEGETPGFARAETEGVVIYRVLAARE